MKRQLKYFFVGIFFLILALLFVTLFPVALKEFGIRINPLAFSQIELFLLIVSSVLFLFSPKYYKWQILIILYGLVYYYIFTRVWF